MKIGEYKISGIKDNKVMFRCYLNIYDEKDAKLNKMVERTKKRLEKSLTNSGYYLTVYEVLVNE